MNDACAQIDDEPTLAQNKQDSATRTVTHTAAATKSPLRAPTIPVEANTRLPVSRAFDCDTALERLTNPTSKDRARLVRPPKYPGLFKRALRDPQSRILAAAILIAGAISLLIVTY
jgi:hypothetical protein